MGKMEQRLHTVSDENKLLANDVGGGTRPTFLDRVSQQVAHAVEDMAIVRTRFASHRAKEMNLPICADEDSSNQSIREERSVDGVGGDESAAGDIDLF